MTPAKLIDAAPQPDSNEGEVISTAESLRSQLIDKPAPPFVTTTPDDKDIALNQFKGKVVLLDFWATWCGPCMQALPAIQRLSVDFKDRPVVVIGINRDKPGDVAKVRKTLERKEITFQQAMDLPGMIAKSYKVSAIPSLILIDNQGVVRAVHVGYEPGEEKVLADEINTLLKGEKIEAVR